MALPSSIPALVTTGQLSDWLPLPGLRVLDASWYLPQAGRDARAEYLAGHIPGAIYFDLDEFSSHQSPLPHMLPTAAEFAARAGGLGISDEDLVVTYDGSGANMSAGRVWWMFRIFGHRRVAVLDGGIRQWRKEGRAVESGPQVYAATTYHAAFAPNAVRGLEAMHDIVKQGSIQVVDARSRGRFEGTAPEPRPGLRGGHLPGSRNLPFQELVDDEGLLLPSGELRRRFAAAGVDLGRPIIVTCGSGVSAGALALALNRLGAESVSLYDGSWTEWAGRDDTPVETGPAR